MISFSNDTRTFWSFFCSICSSEIAIAIVCVGFLRRFTQAGRTNKGKFQQDVLSRSRLLAQVNTTQKI